MPIIYSSSTISENEEKASTSEIIDKTFHFSNAINASIQERVKNITTESSVEKISQEIEKFIGPGTIRQFFLAYPERWPELCNILRTGIAYGGKNHDIISFDQGMYAQDVYALFLVRDRKEDIGQRLVGAIDAEIFHNVELLKYAQIRHSILDIPAHYLQYFDKGQIKSLITQGLTESIEGCNYHNIDEHLSKVLPKMTQYLPLVFGQKENNYDKIGLVGNLVDLASIIESSVKNTTIFKYGAQRCDFMRIIKSFHAWGNIDKIEEAQKNGCEYTKPDHMMALLKKAGLKLKDVAPIDAMDDMYQGTLHFRHHYFPFVWRAKSIKSILHKLWQTPEYGNYEAMRDTLGMTVIVPDNAPHQIITELVQIFTKILPNFGYIVKNRNMVPFELLQEALQKNSVKHKPICPSGRSGTTTSVYLQNIALSGFSKLPDMEHACGTEIQILREGAYHWKKKEDPYYKVKGILELFLRGEFYITPKQLEQRLTKLISPESLKNINEILQETDTNSPLLPIQTIQELINYLININIIIPYSHEGITVYTTQQFQNDFEKIITENSWNIVQNKDTPL